MKGHENATGYEMYYVSPGSSLAHAQLVVDKVIEHAANNLGVGRADRRRARYMARQHVRTAAAKGSHRIEQDNLAQEAGNNILHALRSRL